MYKLSLGLLLLFTGILIGCDSNTNGGYEDGTKLTILFNEASLRTSKVDAVVIDPVKEKALTEEEVEASIQPIAIRVIKEKLYESGKEIASDETPIMIFESDIYHDPIKAKAISKARQSMFYKNSNFSRLLAIKGSARTPYDYSKFDIPSLIKLSNQADTPDWTQVLMFIQAYQTFKDSIGDLTPVILTPEMSVKYIAAINTFKATATPMTQNLAKIVARLHHYDWGNEKTLISTNIESIKRIQNISQMLLVTAGIIDINFVSIDESLNVKKELTALSFYFMNIINQTLNDNITDVDTAVALKDIKKNQGYQATRWERYQAEADKIKDRMAYTERFRKHANATWTLNFENGLVYTFKIHEYNPENGLIPITLMDKHGRKYQGLIMNFISDNILTAMYKSDYSNQSLNLIFDDTFKTISGRVGEYGKTFVGTLQGEEYPS